MRPVNATDTITWLRTRGKPKAAETYVRHGAKDEALGVSYAHINALAKTIKVDHELARALWTSGLHEARILAMKVIDPAALTKADADQWLADVRDHILSGAVAGAIARADDARVWVGAWIASPGEWLSATGWCVLAELAQAGRVAEATGARYLGIIAKELHAAPNRTRHAMNGALIALGGYIGSLRDKADDVAKKLGKVEVDHGDTDCKTPDALSYMAKMDAARAKARAAQRGHSGAPAKTDKVKAPSAKAASKKKGTT